MEKILMELRLSHISRVLCAGVLIVAGGVLASVQWDDCRPVISKLSGEAASACCSPSPTLAPRPEAVVIHVEADKSDIQVSWADN
jgi:hypothetical protein